MIERLKDYREEAQSLLKERWGRFIVAKGLVYTYDQLEGFVYLDDGIKGIITFIVDEHIEIISVDAFEKSQGIGSELIKHMKAYTREKDYERMTLVTTNDNLSAMKFYQKNGFKMKALYKGSMVHARALKPEIPKLGQDNIPIEHEIEFEWIRDLVYHGSLKKGLTSIEPQDGIHGKYVYASKDPVVAALFLTKWHDYIFRLGHKENRVFIVENFPGALKSVYYEKSGSLYELPSEQFSEQEDLWEGEVIANEAISVIKENYIDNIYDYIIHRDKEDLVDVYLYPNRPDFIPEDDSDLLALALENIHKRGQKEVDLFLNYHPSLQDALKEALKDEH